jgi:integrase
MPHCPKPFYRAPLKRWYVQLDGKQIPLGHDPKPARGRRGKPLPPQEVLDRYHELMTTRKNNGHMAVTSDLAVAVIDQFLDWVERRKAPRTYEWYRRHLQNFARSIPKDLSVSRLKPHHVTQVLDAHDDWSPSTKHGFARCVQRAFRWAADEGLIPRSPLAGLTKPEAEARDIVISEEEYQEILSVVNEPSLHDLLIVAWESGARPRELCSVEARHVQLEHGRWVIPRKQAKGKRLPRVVYLTDTALEITERLLEAHPQGPLFRNSNGKPWNRWSINCAFTRVRIALGRKAMKEKAVRVERLPRFSGANVEPGELAEARAKHEAALKERRRKIIRLALEYAPAYNLGAFRHSFGDRALKRGIDPITVANLMGHRNLAMLANTYSHLNLDPGYLQEQARRISKDRGA